MTSQTAVFCVRVRQNLVLSIRRVSGSDVAGQTVFDDRLAVSTELARNNISNGCFDGDYYLGDFEMARHFAALCFGYMKNLCEISLEALNDAGPSTDGGWVNPHRPGAGPPDRGAG